MAMAPGARSMCICYDITGTQRSICYDMMLYIMMPLALLTAQQTVSHE